MYIKAPISIRGEDYHNEFDKSPYQIRIINEKEIIKVENGFARKRPNIHPDFIFSPNEEEEKKPEKKFGYKKYFDPILIWLDKNYKRTLIGEKIIDGVECYEIKFEVLEPKGIRETYIYFDKTNFLKRQMKTASYTVTYSDYRVVNGLKFPFKEYWDYPEVEVLSDNVPIILGDHTIEYLEVTFNQPFDESLFNYSNKK
jgi:hypothetical protein